MLDVRNWEPGGTAPKLEEGGLFPTFATEGTNAWFSGNLDANGSLSSTHGTLVPQDSGSTVRLENEVVDKPMSVPCKLISGQGTTNLINSPVTWAGGTLSIENNSQLTFAGGVGDIGWSGATGAGKDVSTLVVTHGALSGAQLTFTKLTVHLQASGSSADYGVAVDNNAQVFLQTKNALTTGTPFYLFGPVDFCGQDQQCGFLRESKDTGKFTSEKPAVLTVNQGSGENATAATFIGHFEGAAGLKKTSATTLTLDATNPTTGSLEVAGGGLVLGPKGTWGCTCVSLTGADAVLTLQDSKNLNRKTKLEVRHAGAQIELAAGVEARVHQLYVSSAADPTVLTMLNPGVYTSANCKYITGDGSIKVRGDGMILLFR